MHSFKINDKNVLIYPSKLALSCVAADQAALILREVISRKGSARMIIGAGNSQQHFFRALSQSPEVDWKAVELFHVDEYVELPPLHPASFRLWVKTHFADIVRPGEVHYMNVDAPDLEADCRITSFGSRKGMITKYYPTAPALEMARE